MSDKPKSISFNLKALRTDQFATIDKNYVEGKEINLAHQLKFGANPANRSISVGADFNFEIEKNPFLIIGVSGHFEIQPEAWDTFFNEDTSKLIVPKGLMAHLAMITVGSARGVLHAKTENTPYNKFLLPTVNVAAIIKEDVHISLAKPA